MGGAKKKAPAKQEKSQSSKPAEKNTKKPKGKESSSAPKAEITVILTDEQATKLIRGSKFVTVLELAKKAGIKASTANAYLRRACDAGTLRRAGGNSGHWIYAPTASLKTSPDPSSSSPPA